MKQETLKTESISDSLLFIFAMYLHFTFSFYTLRIFKINVRHGLRTEGLSAAGGKSTEGGKRETETKCKRGFQGDGTRKILCN